MTNLYKVVVTGPFNAGKTTFIQTISDIEVVNTDKAVSRPGEVEIKPTTTVALDYGHVRIDQADIHLFGTPGQARFDFMGELLAEGMDGFIFLIDSTDGNRFEEAAASLALFRRWGNAPCLVVANKIDQPGLKTEEIRKALKLPKSQPLMSCVATDKNSVRTVLECLITVIGAAS